MPCVSVGGLFYFSGFVRAARRRVGYIDWCVVAASVCPGEAHQKTTDLRGTIRRSKSGGGRGRAQIADSRSAYPGSKTHSLAVSGHEQASQNPTGFCTAGSVPKTRSVY